MKTAKKMSHKIIASYINNFEFRIPKPEVFFKLSKDISNYKINLDIKSKEHKQKIIEVNVSLSLIPVNKSEDNIHTSITYASIVQIEDNVSKEELEKIVLINVPKKIYNNLRDAFIFSFESCGFKDIKIDKEVDFEKLYLSRKTSKNFS